MKNLPRHAALLVLVACTPAQPGRGTSSGDTTSGEEVWLREARLQSLVERAEPMMLFENHDR